MLKQCKKQSGMLTSLMVVLMLPLISGCQNTTGDFCDVSETFSWYSDTREYIRDNDPILMRQLDRHQLNREDCPKPFRLKDQKVCGKWGC